MRTPIKKKDGSWISGQRTKDGKVVFTHGPKKVNRKRKASEYARCYHSKARVLFVKSLSCIVYRCANRDVENAHVIDDGTKGAGRKSGYACVAPLCHTHHRGGDLSLHVLNANRFEAVHGVHLRTAAANTELQWRNHVG